MLHTPSRDTALYLIETVKNKLGHGHVVWS